MHLTLSCCHAVLSLVGCRGGFGRRDDDSFGRRGGCALPSLPALAVAAARCGHCQQQQWRQQQWRPRWLAVAAGGGRCFPACLATPTPAHARSPALPCSVPTCSYGDRDRDFDRGERRGYGFGGDRDRDRDWPARRGPPGGERSGKGWWCSQPLAASVGAAASGKWQGRPAFFRRPQLAARLGTVAPRASAEPPSPRPPPCAVPAGEPASPRERPKLVLAPRSAAADGGGEGGPPKPRSNPFGDAKPVDTLAKEREIEERQKQRQAEEEASKRAAKEAAKEAAEREREKGEKDKAERERQRSAAKDAAAAAAAERERERERAAAAKAAPPPPPPAAAKGAGAPPPPPAGAAPAAAAGGQEGGRGRGAPGLSQKVITVPARGRGEAAGRGRGEGRGVAGRGRGEHAAPGGRGEARPGRGAGRGEHGGRGGRGEGRGAGRGGPHPGRNHEDRPAKVGAADSVCVYCGAIWEPAVSSACQPAGCQLGLAGAGYTWLPLRRASRPAVPSPCCACCACCAPPCQQAEPKEQHKTSGPAAEHLRAKGVSRAAAPCCRTRAAGAAAPLPLGLHARARPGFPANPRIRNGGAPPIVQLQPALPQAKARRAALCCNPNALRSNT